MRSSTDHYVAFGFGLLTVLLLAYALYRPKVQESKPYQATVVPLANIMDVGFIIFSPAIVLLAGFRAPFFMLGICLVAIAAGFAIAYNIRNYVSLRQASTDRTQLCRSDRFEVVAVMAHRG
jgi:hypothetical protein